MVGNARRKVRRSRVVQALSNSAKIRALHQQEIRHGNLSTGGGPVQRRSVL